MSTAKTKISREEVRAFLANRGVREDSIQKIAGGELSQAFYFDNETGQKVLRVSSYGDEGFQKDKLAAENIADASIFIPRIYDIGELSDGLHFAISERALGLTLDELRADIIDELMPEIIKFAQAIAEKKPLAQGYGRWNAVGEGKHDSWQEALEQMQKADDDAVLAQVGFFDEEYNAELAQEIEGYYRFCPNDRKLIHGDYGFSNVVSDGGRITGVFDWNESMYGDALYDVAWLDFWGGARGYAQHFLASYSSGGDCRVNFWERLTCYQLVIGANALCFFAKSGQPEKYKYAKEVVAKIRQQVRGG